MRCLNLSITATLFLSVMVVPSAKAAHDPTCKIKALDLLMEHMIAHADIMRCATSFNTMELGKRSEERHKVCGLIDHTDYFEGLMRFLK